MTADLPPPTSTWYGHSWAWARSLLTFKSGRPGRSLSALQIFWRFTQDTLLTAAIYVLLVLATKVLQYFAESMKESPLHHQVLEFLEHAIFLAGSAMIFLVLLSVTIISAVDLFRSFKASFTESTAA